MDKFEKEYASYPDHESRICGVCGKPLKKLPIWVDDEIKDMQGLRWESTDSKPISVHINCQRTPPTVEPSGKEVLD